ncbi:MAG: methyltransferase domain-containing protein [Synechococcaceae cyanobacterium ELA445]
MNNMVFMPSIVKVEQMPTKEALDEHYKQYFQNNSIYSQPERPEEVKYRHAMAVAKLAMIGQVGRQPLSEASLLEIGYGQGDFLSAAFTQCKSIQGIDFTLTSLRSEHKHIREFCREGNPDDLLQEAISTGTTFDLINATHVLEHSSEPESLLKLLSNLLGLDGLLVVEIPNDFSPLQKILTDKGLVDSPYWVSVPDHLCYWNKERLQQFISNNDLAIIDAFGDFPIELLLLTEDFNYKRHSQLGKPAHLARCLITEYVVEHVAMPELLNLARSLYACDLSRSYTYVLAKS